MSKKKEVISREEKAKNYQTALRIRERVRVERENLVKAVEKEEKKYRVGSSKFDLGAECKNFAPEIFANLKAVVNSKSRFNQMKMGAIRELLDRGFGKAKEQIDVTGGFVLKVERADGKGV